MLNITVFAELPDCTRVFHRRITDSTYVYIKVEQYKIYVDDVEIEDDKWRFNVALLPGTHTLRINSLIPDYEDYVQVFESYDIDTHIEAHLSPVRATRVISEEYPYCGRGVGVGIVGGAIYTPQFTVMFPMTDTLGVTTITNVPVILEYARDANYMYRPSTYNDEVGLLLNTLGVTYDNFIGYISADYIIEACGETYTIPANTYTVDTIPYNIWLALYLNSLEPDVVEQCCGQATVTTCRDCRYPYTVGRGEYYRHEIFSSRVWLNEDDCGTFVDVYKASNALNAVLLRITTCDTTTNVVRDISVPIRVNTDACNDSVNIQTRIDNAEQRGCCGSSITYLPSCIREYVVATNKTCAPFELIITQDTCITRETLSVSVNTRIRNTIVNPAHKRYILYRVQPLSLQDNYLTQPSEPIRNCDFNSSVITYKLYKTYKNVRTLVNESDELPTASVYNYTFEEYGVYDVVAQYDNCCKSIQTTKTLKVYDKVYILQDEEACAKFTIYACLSKDINVLLTNAFTNEVLWSNGRRLLEPYNKASLAEAFDYEASQDATYLFKYDEDANTIAFKLSKDGVYNLALTYNGETYTYVIIQDCAISTCHQEYVHSLLCEDANPCKLLEDCVQNNNTTLLKYALMKYIFLYDVYLTLRNKLINSDYTYLINPTPALEVHNVVDYYNLERVMTQLSKLCALCGTTNSETIYDNSTKCCG